VDGEHRRWLEQLVAACERVLERRDGDRTDKQYAELRADVAELLTRLRAELRAPD
jgi:ElaB/YqjD/DUF883 family membrane-anchored ribosome-binding protein